MSYHGKEYEDFDMVRRSEDCLNGVMGFLRGGGLLWRGTTTGRLYLVFCLVFCGTGALQLMYSIVHFGCDVGRATLAAYHSVLILVVPVAITCCAIWHDNVEHTLKGSCCSFNYGGKIMLKIQEELLQNKKELTYRKMSRYLPIMNSLMMANVMFASLLDKFVFGKSRIELYPAWYPSSCDDHQIVTYFQQALTMTLAGFTVFSILGLSIVIRSHLSTEFQLLARALERLGERALEMAKSQNCGLCSAYKESIRMCLRHHIFLLGYFRSIQTTLKMAYSLCYFIGLLLLALTGCAFILDSWAERIKFVIITMIELCYLFCVSWAAQEIQDKGMMINAAVYGVEWLSLPRECISSLRILLLANQRPLIVTTLLGQNVNLLGYMTLLNASYSYFNLIYMALEKTK